MTIHQIQIKASPLKILDIIFSKEGSSFFRDAKPYSKHYSNNKVGGMKACWRDVCIQLQHYKPCGVKFDIKKRGLMKVDGELMMNRDVAVVSYHIHTWVPLYKKMIDQKMQRAIIDIGNISSTH
jgi:hypothetical protein